MKMVLNFSTLAALVGLALCCQGLMAADNDHDSRRKPAPIVTNGGARNMEAPITY